MSNRLVYIFNLTGRVAGKFENIHLSSVKTLGRFKHLRNKIFCFDRKFTDINLALPDLREKAILLRTGNQWLQSNPHNSTAGIREAKKISRESETSEKVNNPQIHHCIDFLSSFPGRIQTIVEPVVRMSDLTDKLNYGLKKDVAAWNQGVFPYLNVAGVMHHILDKSKKDIHITESTGRSEKQDITNRKMQISGVPNQMVYPAPAGNPKKIIPIINHRVSGRNELYATQKHSAHTTNAWGLIMNHPVNDLTCLNYTFTGKQQQMLKTNKESKSIFMPDHVIRKPVGIGNEIFASSPEVKWKPDENRINRLRETIGQGNIQFGKSLLTGKDFINGLSGKMATWTESGKSAIMDVMHRIWPVDRVLKVKTEEDKDPWDDVIQDDGENYARTKRGKFNQSLRGWQTAVGKPAVGKQLTDVLKPARESLAPVLPFTSSPTAKRKDNLLEDTMYNIRRVAAATVLPLSVSMASQADMKATVQTGPVAIERTMKDPSQYASAQGKTIQIDRICEQIVIHVQNTDNQGKEEIRAAIFEVLNEIAEG